MKVGMYLAYAPSRKKYSLKQEGLGRYTSFIIKGLIANDHRVVIACPRWIENAVYELLEEQDIDKNKVELVTPKAEPILFRIISKLSSKEKKEKRKKKYEATQKLIDGMITFLLSLKNIFVFSLLLIVAFVLSVIFAAFGVVALALYIIYKILRRFPMPNKDTIKNKISREGKKGSSLYHLYVSLKEKYNIVHFQEIMRLDTGEELVRRINTLKDHVDVWYSPTAFWKEFNHIKTTKVMCLPDVVTAEFPIYFGQDRAGFITKRVLESVDEATHFITYSDFVKDDILIKKMSKSEENVVAIPHAPNDMSKFINVDDFFGSKYKNATDMFVRNVVIKSVLGKCVKQREYLLNGYNAFPLQDVDYIFYASQVRGNKNMINLVKAYEFLLREKKCRMKLVLTCDYTKDETLKNYIEKHRLQYDVLSFYGLNNQQLAALYFCAKLVVNPTLYEGGFPFTFGEALSVNTPVILSDIPQVREGLAEYDNIEKIVFDPYSYKEIAYKIMQALDGLDELRDEELRIYNTMSKRDWKMVGEEYVKAFEYFAKKESEIA